MGSVGVEWRQTRGRTPFGRRRRGPAESGKSADQKNQVWEKTRPIGSALSPAPSLPLVLSLNTLPIHALLGTPALARPSSSTAIHRSLPFDPLARFPKGRVQRFGFVTAWSLSNQLGDTPSVCVRISEARATTAADKGTRARTHAHTLLGVATFNTLNSLRNPCLETACDVSTRPCTPTLSTSRPSLYAVAETAATATRAQLSGTWLRWHCDKRLERL